MIAAIPNDFSVMENGLERTKQWNLEKLKAAELREQVSVIRSSVISPIGQDLKSDIKREISDDEALDLTRDSLPVDRLPSKDNLDVDNCEMNDGELDSGLMVPSADQKDMPDIIYLYKCFKASSEAAQNILTDEVNILYECKACRNIFRDLANLLAHKSFYCHHTTSDIAASPLTKEFINIEERLKNKATGEVSPVEYHNEMNSDSEVDGIKPSISNGIKRPLADTPFSCTICNVKFTSLGRRRQHDVAKHGIRSLSPNKPLKRREACYCPICSLSCVGSWQLQVHMKFRHGSSKDKVRSDVEPDAIDFERNEPSPSKLTRVLNRLSSSPVSSQKEASLDENASPLVTDKYDFIKTMCLRCDRKFSNWFGLLQHLRLTHDHELVYNVIKTQLDKLSGISNSAENGRIVLDSNYKTPDNTVHKPTPTPHVPEVRSMSVIKQYSHVIDKPTRTCLICQKSMFDLSGLRRHMLRMHPYAIKKPDVPEKSPQVSGNENTSLNEFYDLIDHSS